jgi:hypothetical protein
MSIATYINAMKLIVYFSFYMWSMIRLFGGQDNLYRTHDNAVYVYSGTIFGGTNKTVTEYEVDPQNAFLYLDATYDNVNV